MPGPHSWSVDASLNDVIDPDIYFAEGQPPPTLNNSCRGMMAGIAKHYLDESGSLDALDAANDALTLSSYQGFEAEDFGRAFRLTFMIAAANTGPVTLSVDNTPAKPLRRSFSRELAPGDLQPDVIYCVIWRPSLGAFRIITPEIAAPGAFREFVSEAAIPPSWIPCDGRALSRATYPALFAMIGVVYGAGDGSTTFNVPDARGRSLYCSDRFGTGANANRLTGAGGLNGTIGSAGGTETVALTTAQMPTHDHGGSTGNGGGSTATTTSSSGGVAAGTTGAAGSHGHTGNTTGAGAHGHTGTATASGDHTHSYNQPATKGGQGGGSGTFGYWFGGDAATNTAGSGPHTHPLSIDPAADHTHGLAINGVGDHVHSLPAVPDHSHNIPASSPHAHGIAAAGSGAAHPNMPPGLVVVFAIKA